MFVKVPRGTIDENKLYAMLELSRTEDRASLRFRARSSTLGSTVTRQRRLARLYLSLLLGASLVIAGCLGFANGEAPAFLPLAFVPFEVLFRSLWGDNAGAYVGSGIMLILGGIVLTVEVKRLRKRDAP